MTSSALPHPVRSSLPAISAADAVYRKVSWRLISLLFICYIAAYLDRVNVGFAKVQMQDALQLSEAVYGLGAGIFFVGYFLFEMPNNVNLHKVGARRWIARGAAAAAGIAFINSFGNLSGFAAPYLIAVIKEATRSTDAGLHMVAALLVLGAVLVLCVKRPGAPK